MSRYTLFAFLASLILGLATNASIATPPAATGFAQQPAVAVKETKLQPGSFATVTPDQPNLPAGTAPDWWGKVQKQLADQEYQVTAQAEANCTPEGTHGPVHQAPNRAHNFRTCFSEHGVTVVPR